MTPDGRAFAPRSATRPDGAPAREAPYPVPYLNVPRRPSRPFPPDFDTHPFGYRTPAAAAHSDIMKFVSVGRSAGLRHDSHRDFALVEASTHVPLCLLRNDFCEFPWPAKLGWKFESTYYGDSRTLVLAPKGRALHGMIQVWNLDGSDLQAIPKGQWSRLAAAPRGFPPGVSVEQIETVGMFSHWIGVSSHVSHDCNRFADFELMSTQGNAVIYYRRSTTDPESLDLRLELSMIRVADPGLWVAGAQLDRVLLPNRG